MQGLKTEYIRETLAFLRVFPPKKFYYWLKFLKNKLLSYFFESVSTKMLLRKTPLKILPFTTTSP